MLEPKALVRALKEGNERIVDPEKKGDPEPTDDEQTRDGFQFKIGSRPCGLKRCLDLEGEYKNLEATLSAPRTTVRSCQARANAEQGKVKVVKGQGRLANCMLEPEAALVALENHSLVVEEIESLQEGWAAVLSSIGVKRQCTFSTLSRAGYKLASYQPRAYLPINPVLMDNDVDVEVAEVLHGVALDSPVWWVEELLLDILNCISSEAGGRLRNDGFPWEQKVSASKRDHYQPEFPGSSNLAKRVKIEGVGDMMITEGDEQLPDQDDEEIVEVKREQANIFINPLHQTKGGAKISDDNQVARGLGSLLQELRQNEDTYMDALTPEEAPIEILPLNEVKRKEAHARARAALDNLRGQGKELTDRRRNQSKDTRSKIAEFRCDVCAITLNSATVLRQHFIGKKHLKAVAAQIPRLEREEKEAAEGIVEVEVPVEVAEKEVLDVETSTLPSKEKLLSLLPDSSTTSLVIVNRPDSSLIPANTWPDSRPSAFLEVKRDGRVRDGDEDLKQQVWEENSEKLVKDEAEVICMDEEEIVCIAAFKENPTGARPFRGFWPGSKVSIPLAVKKGEANRKYNFGHCSKPSKMGYRGRGRVSVRSRGGEVIRGRGRAEPMRMRFSRGRRGSSITSCGPSAISGRGRAGRGESGRWWAENVGPNTCSNPSLPSHLATDSSQNKANQIPKSSRPTPTPPSLNITEPKATAETVVVDLSSDSEFDSPPNSPRSYSSSPSSSWTTTPSPEGQDDMMVPLFLQKQADNQQTIMPSTRCTLALSFYGPAPPSPPCGRQTSVLSYAQKWVPLSERYSNRD